MNISLLPKIEKTYFGEERKMADTKYIRPMSFRATIGTMYRLYLKIMVPITLLNIVVVIFLMRLSARFFSEDQLYGSDYLMLLTGLFAGVFVGPILMMTSNVILRKRVKVWESLRKGISLGLFLKITLVVIVYTIILAIIGKNIYNNLYISYVVGESIFIYGYLFLSPIWVFIPMIMILEKKGLRASFKRSFQILRKNFLRILQMDIFITLIFTILALILTNLEWDPAYSPDINFLSSLSDAIVIPVIFGFNTLPYVFVYYEYRARHENYSEELLTQEMGYQPMEEMMSV
jgi:hypothetical protein